jgi:uncharacterized protein with HEPN domain
MNREPVAFLWDIHLACDAIADFTKGLDLQRYEADLLLRSAVERQLQNMGEALSQLSKIDLPLAGRVPRWRQLIGFRNILVHGYAGLDDAEVWRVLQENLPALRAAVGIILIDLGSTSPP